MMKDFSIPFTVQNFGKLMLNFATDSVLNGFKNGFKTVSGTENPQKIRGVQPS